MKKEHIRLFQKVLLKLCPGRVNAGRGGSRRFMTLTEVMVAVMVSSIAVGGSISVLKQGLWGTNYLRRRSTAVDIAKNRLEQLRSSTYVDLPLMTEDMLRVNAEGIAAPDGRFLRSTAVGSDLANSRVVTVDVATKWRPDSEPLEVTVSTILVDKNKFQYRITHQ